MLPKYRPDQTYTLQEAAKFIGLGAKTLFERLRKEKILDPHNLPYRKYINLGYLKTADSQFNDPTNGLVPYQRPMLTSDGLIWLTGVVLKGKHQPKPKQNNDKQPGIAANINQILGHYHWQLTLNPDGSGDVITNDETYFFQDIKHLFEELQQTPKPQNQTHLMEKLQAS